MCRPTFPSGGHFFVSSPSSSGDYRDRRGQPEWGGAGGVCARVSGGAERAGAAEGDRAGEVEDDGGGAGEGGRVVAARGDGGERTSAGAADGADGAACVARGPGASGSFARSGRRRGTAAGRRGAGHRGRGPRVRRGAVPH